jgi:hypothetical protein
MKTKNIKNIYWPMIAGALLNFENIIEGNAQKKFGIIDHISFYNINFEIPLKKDEIFNCLKIRRYKLIQNYILFLRIQNQIVYLFSYGINFFIKLILPESFQ